MRQRIGVLLVTALLLVGTVVPATVGAMAVTGDATGPNAVGGVLVAQQSNETVSNETANGSVNVSTGAQLATVLAVTNDDIQTEVDDTAFEVEYEDGDGETRVEAVAKRGAALRERAEAIRADYETATAAYENGTITASEYAQRLATLNARAENVVRSYERLEVRSEGLSALDLRAAGLNESALRTSVSNLDDLRGVGAAALFERFTGEREGELELRTADGLRIEFESEDGEESREFTRPRDADTNITVSQSAAFDTATGVLSTPTSGEWALERSSVHPESGYYKFEFVLDSASAEGEAEVRVDGSTGEVFRLEEEIEARDGDDADEDRDDEGEDDERDDDRRERLRLLVVDGTVAPGEAVTVQVLADGTPVEGATVTLNDRSVGTTDADGTVDVTLPTDGEAEFRAEHGEAEGELEFEFGEDDRVVRDLRVDAEQTDGRVTVTVTYQGNGVADATVFADGERVGTTDADGVVSFDATVREDLEVTLVKGEFEAELTLVADGDTLRVGDLEVDGESDDDSDGDDRDEEDRERDDADSRERDDDERDDRDRDDDGEDVDDEDESDDEEESDDDSGSDGGR